METLNQQTQESDTRYAVKVLFEGIREELDEHLDSINQNTNEISSSHEYLCELDYKFNKLSERIDQLELFLEHNLGFSRVKKPKFEPKPLTNNEQDVFLVLYTLEERKGAVSYPDIAKRTGLSEDLVNHYISRMIEKNVPIIKRFVNNTPHLRLDPLFKRIQAKENILGLNQKTMSSF